MTLSHIIHSYYVYTIYYTLYTIYYTSGTSKRKAPHLDNCALHPLRRVNNIKEFLDTDYYYILLCTPMNIKYINLYIHNSNATFKR